MSEECRSGSWRERGELLAFEEVLEMIEKRLFRVELQTWPAREIPLLVFGFNEEDAEKER